MIITYLDKSTTPLDSEATYTGPWVRGHNVVRYTATVKSDQNGMVYLDQSSDGENADYISSFNLVANTGLGISVEAIAPFTRLRIVNGDGGAQTYLRGYLHGRAL
jgi:hypothetical protein